MQQMLGNSKPVCDQSMRDGLHDYHDGHQYSQDQGVANEAEPPSDESVDCVA